MFDRELQIVTFRLGKETFGLHILKVQEVIKKVEIVTIPKSPDFIEGVINLRGNIVPIICLRKKFGLPKAEEDPKNRMVVCDFGAFSLGFIVDEVNEVMNIPGQKLENIPPVISTYISEDVIEGVINQEDGMIIMLKIEDILTGDQKEFLIQRSFDGEEEEEKTSGREDEKKGRG